MHPLVNHLVQLQELTLVRDEQKVTPAGLSRLAQLDASIKAMTEQLPPDICGMFVKLHKKDHVVLAPVSEGICAVCGMRLPISLVQAVRLGREIHNCPSCARIMYCCEQMQAPKRLGKTPRRTDPRKVGIARFTSETLMIPRLEAGDKEGVIRELAYKMEYEGFVDHADKLVDIALRREAILCTAVDHGLAFPHARGVEGGGLTLALGLSPKGVDFGGTGDNLTKIVFLLAIPTAASAFYLRLLAGLTETFMKAENRKVLLAEKEPGKLWKTLAKVTRATIK